jgi:hypothetical protein
VGYEPGLWYGPDAAVAALSQSHRNLPRGVDNERGQQCLLRQRQGCGFMNSRAFLGGGILALVVLSGSAAAQEIAVRAGTVELSAGAGMQGLFANEIVYLNKSPDTTELSHLFWMSAAPVLTTSLQVKLPQG